MLDACVHHGIWKPVFTTLPKRLNVKQICVDDIISRSRREEIKTTIEKAKLGHHVKLRTHSCGEHDIMMTIDCV